MGKPVAVPYQHMPLFRKLAQCPELRPKNNTGQPHRAVTAFCLVYTGLHRLQPAYVRAPENWEPPRTADTGILVRHFIHYTLVRYPVPALMYKAWESDNDLHKRWFIHLGAGKNLRKAEGLPFLQPMTKMHAHHFCAAPSWMSINQALRYGQLRSMGADIRLAKAVATACTGTEIVQEQEAFWLAAFRQILGYEMGLSAYQVRAILGKWKQLFWDNREIITDAGRVKTVVPPEPLHPGTQNCLVEMLTLLKPKPETIGWSENTRIYEEKPFPKFKEVAKLNKKEQWLLRAYEIRQLLTWQELLAEGQAMQHCVATYRWACEKGRSFIFSFRQNGGAFNPARLTVEVGRNDRIVQVKGPNNRRPVGQERVIIRAWAAVARVSCQCYDMEERED